MLPLIVAHRGASGYLPENTLEAFELAISQGAHMIELDVHSCASGDAIVIHDPTLERTTNGSGEVLSYSLEELKQFLIEDEQLRIPATRIPTLEETIVLAHHRIGLMIELKGVGSGIATGKLLQRMYGSAIPDSLIFCSFLTSELEALYHFYNNAYFALITEQLPCPIPEFSKGIHPHHELLNPSVIAQFKQQRLQVNTWTINDPGLIPLLIALEVNGICSDFPDLALQALAGHT